MTPQRAKDLVYIHTNLHLPPRQSSICSLGGTRIWDLEEDEIDLFDGEHISDNNLLLTN